MTAYHHSARQWGARRLRAGQHRRPTLDQHSAALAAAGVTKTFSDTMSGARMTVQVWHVRITGWLKLFMKHDFDQSANVRSV